MIRKTFESVQNVEYLHRVACEAHESRLKSHFTLISAATRRVWLESEKDYLISLTPAWSEFDDEGNIVCSAFDISSFPDVFTKR